VMACMEKIKEDLAWEGSIDILPPTISFPQEGMTDVTWFTENFYCLLTNAIKYSLNSEIIVRTFMITVENQHFAEFRVMDSG
jgi:signal transduction histidine kinase